MASMNNLPTESVLTRYWRRLPIVIRAIVSGYFVFAIAGVFAWMAVLTFLPVPWSLVVMWVFLGLYLLYFSGRWWPKSMAEPRAENFRSTKLSASTWKWSLFATLLITVVIESSLVVTFRIVTFPADAWNLGMDYQAFPLWQVWLYIVLAASVAGITEEVGFRGYMQVPLEKRYGPPKGIILVAIMFMIFHLNQAWAPFVLLHLFVYGAMWGVLAYVSDSIIPGIISHILVDIFSFSYWWTDVAGSFNKQTIFKTGLDGHFTIWLMILFASIVLYVWAARKTFDTHKSGEE